MDRLTSDLLLRLLALRDPWGIISIYAGTTPERQVHAKPEWIIPIRNGLRDLRDRSKEEGPRERWVAVSQRVDDLESRLDRLLDPSREGRGRALFVPLASDEPSMLFLQVPLPDLVVMSQRAHVRPLVAVADEARPAGIVFADRSGAKVWEIAYGEVIELASYDFSDAGYADTLRGPAPTNPAMSQQASAQRDTADNRMDASRGRFLKDRAADVQRRSAGRNWDRIVVAGDYRFAAPFEEALNSMQLIRTDRDLRQASQSELAEVVLPVLDVAQREWEMSLVAQAVNAALAGGHGTVGVSDVAGALEQGRVQHLIYDDALELQGVRLADGRLEPNAADDVSDTTPEPNLVEAMVEQALQSSARVTPVSGEAAEALKDHEGMAALLRW